MVTLQFSSQDRIGSKAIQFFTWSEYSHVDIVLTDGKLFGARGDGVKIREPWGCYDRIIRKISDAPESIIDKALTQEGKPYDYTALLGFLARRDWTKDCSWFCSELVAWAFSEEGYPLLNADNYYRITPRDLLLSPYLEDA